MDYPNVPDLPGVPPLLRDPLNSFSSSPPLSSDSSAVSAGSDPVWGIFTAKGAKAITADSVVNVGYYKDYDIAKYPMEKGAFQSYNKVEIPYSLRIMLTRTGTPAQRKTFIQTLDNLVKSLDLYTIVTPECSYMNANPVHVEYDRTQERGAGMIRAELRFEQVREDATEQFSNTKTAGAVPTVDAGAVQPQDPTEPQARQIASEGIQ